MPSSNLAAVLLIEGQFLCECCLPQVPPQRPRRIQRMAGYRGRIKSLYDLWLPRI